MQKIADRYEEEIDEKISHTIGILEPTLVAVLSVVTRTDPSVGDASA